MGVPLPIPVLPCTCSAETVPGAGKATKPHGLNVVPVLATNLQNTPLPTCAGPAVPVILGSSGEWNHHHFAQKEHLQVSFQRVDGQGGKVDLHVYYEFRNSIQILYYR